LGLTFFTLPTDYKIQLHTQIWELVYFGNGGFNWADVYNMPIHLRKFYFNKLIEFKKKEAEEVKKAQSKAKVPKVRMR
jgi:hypothetical protein